MGTRSRGVTLLATAYLIVSSLLLLVQVFGFLVVLLVKLNRDTAWAQQILQATPLSFTPLQLVTSVVAVAITSGFLAGSLGVLGLKDWGRQLMLWSAGVAIPNGFIGALLGASERASAIAAQNPNFPTPLVVALGMVVFVPIVLILIVTLWFLNRASVRAQFAPAAPTRAA